MYASTKLDGIRAVVLNGQLVSRTLKPIRNRHIQSVLARPELEGLDGELIIGAPYGEGVFQRSISGVMSQEGRPDFTYYVFDNHVLGRAGMIFGDRTEAVKESVKSLEHLFPQIIYLAQWPIMDINRLEQLEESFVQQGYEGVILRWAMAPYKLDRSTLKERYMLKLKRFSDSEARIVGFEELLHNDNEAQTDERGYTHRSSHKANKRGGGTLGKLRVQSISRPEWEFSIGTGLDFSLRNEIWNNQPKFIDRIVKFKYLEVGTLDLPRHPVFLGFRHSDDL